jgi:signal transduction histidine kinase
MWWLTDLRRLVAMHQMPQPPSPQPAALPGAGTSTAGCSLPWARAILALAPLMCALSGGLDLCVGRGVASWIWAEPVLAVLASIVAASAAQLRRQADELQASRTRIVAAADSERRRIERNLHDGAQQRLAALAIKVSMACELAGNDAGQARALLAELRGDVRETAEELRHLAHGIYPPLLADSGLPAALAAAAGRATLPVTVQAAPLGRYPAEVEATVYFCCLEAIQNACKHAGDEATLALRVWEEGSALAFDVTDDGSGFDAGGRGLGAGFTNMEDRLCALRGSLLVESAPGRGTRVSGQLPARQGAGPGATAAHPRARLTGEPESLRGESTAGGPGTPAFRDGQCDRAA